MFEEVTKRLDDIRSSSLPSVSSSIDEQVTPTLETLKNLVSELMKMDGHRDSLDLLLSLLADTVDNAIDRVFEIKESIDNKINEIDKLNEDFKAAFDTNIDESGVNRLESDKVVDKFLRTSAKTFYFKEEVDECLQEINTLILEVAPEVEALAMGSCMDPDLDFKLINKIRELKI